MLFFPGLLPTGKIDSQLLTIRDGFVNMYVLKASTKLICIDTGWRSKHMLREFNTLQLDIQEVAAVFLTHLHWDHARCTGIFPNAEIYVSEKTITSFSNRKPRSKRPWIQVQDDQQISVSGLQVRFINTPGHTADSVSFLVGGKLLFTGDCLRLCEGEALPFYSCFNKVNTLLAGSARRLANLKGVESLLTAHTGITNNTDRAFAKWREHATAKKRSVTR